MSTRRPTWIAALCWPALLLALAGSVSNLAWSFASVQAGNLVLGYIQAGAVDLGLHFAPQYLQLCELETRLDRWDLDQERD